MKTTKPEWNNKTLARMAQNGTLRFDYPIQRARGQWDSLQKSLLIHSLVDGYPIPPVCIVKRGDDGKTLEYVIDGKQRITTVLDYMSGVKNKDGEYPNTAFPLHEFTPEVELEGADKPYAIAGKYYDELDSDIQSELQSSKFQIQRLEDATDEEIEELFSRWNNGTPLTKQQKARGKMGTDKAILIDSLQHHPFMQKFAQFTPLQRRRSDDESVIMQSLMLLDDIEIESFVADKLLEYAKSIRNKDISKPVESLTKALDYLASVNVSSPLFKKLHLPMIFLVAEEAADKNVSTDVFEAWLNDFNHAINSRTKTKALVPTKYKNYTGAGSVKRDKVLGRKAEMMAHFKKFLAEYKGEQEQNSEQEKKDEQVM